MAVVGFNLSKILIEREDVLSGKIDIKSKIDVTDIQKQKMELAPGKEVLKATFLFEILYEPKFAKIDMKGHILLLEDPKKAKEILNDWKKKKITEDVKEQIYNLILRKCNIKAFQLEEDLNLPTHFPMPSLRKEAGQ